MNSIILQIYNHILSMLFEAIEHDDKRAILIYKELILFIINTHRIYYILKEKGDKINDTTKI